MKKIFSLIIAAALLFMSCLADENSVSVEVDNSNVHIEGGGAEENAYVTLQVFLRTNTSKMLESMTYPDYTDVLVCHDQTRADADGNYSFSFDIDNDTAEYTAYINTGSSDDVISKTFSFVNMKQFESVANALNTSTSASEISKLISDNKEVFDLTETEIKNMDLSAFSTIILNYTQSGNAFSNTDRTSVIRIIDKIYYIQQLNESKIDDLYTETEVNGLDTSVTMKSASKSKSFAQPIVMTFLMK